MTFKSYLLVVSLSFFLSHCTGSNEPLYKHDGAKESTRDGGKIQKDASHSKDLEKAVQISVIENDEEKLKQAEAFIFDSFWKAELKVKYAQDSLNLISFALKKWAEKSNIESFNRLVNLLFSDIDQDDRILVAFANSQTKKLIIQSVKLSKDSQFKFKLIVLFKKIQPHGLTGEDITFIQNQLNSIKNETNFNFTGTSAAWIKSNRDLIQTLISNDQIKAAQIDESEFSSANLNRFQRTQILISFLKLKKSIVQVLSISAAKDFNDYSAQFRKIKIELPIVFNQLKVEQIVDETHLALIASILNSDLDSSQVVELSNQGLLNKGNFEKSLKDWSNFEIAKIIWEFKNGFSQFQQKRINYSPVDYFPELKRALNASQINTRDRVRALRIFIPIAEALSLNSFKEKILNLDLFFKRLLTSNSSLLLLDLFKKSGLQLKSEVVLNNRSIKKNSANNLKTSLLIPNVLMVSEGFYLGELADQFEFSENDRMLQTFEVLDGIDEAVQLGLFRELGFNDTDIFRSLFIWLTQSRLVQVEVLKSGQSQEVKVFKLHEHLKLKKSSAEWQSFKESCRLLKSNQSIPREFDLEDIQSSLLFGRLARNIEANPTSTEHGGSANLMGLFPYNSEVTKSLEFLRSDVSYMILFLETIMDSLKSAGIGFSSLETELVHFKSFYRDYLNEYLPVINEFDECYFLKRKKEQDLITKVFEYESKYWEFVISKLSGVPNQTPSSILPLSFDLPKGVLQRSYFTENGLQLNPIDFYFRIKQYLEFGLDLGNGKKWPAIDSAIHIKFSSQMTTQSIYKNASLKTIVFQNESISNRIQKIITAHDFTGSTFVHWFAKGFASVSKFIEQIDTLSILYRFSAELKDSFGIETKVTLDHLTQTYYRVMYVYHLSDEMKSVLNLVSLKELGYLDDLINFKIILTDKDIALPFYDRLMTSMAKPFMGYYGEDANFMGGGDSRTLKRPIQLQSTNEVVLSLYRFSDESYNSPVRNKKVIFLRFIRRISEDLSVGQSILKYVQQVAKTRNEETFTIQLRTNQAIRVPLYSLSIRDNLSAVMLDLENKLQVIKNDRH